jgi:hypothetical protein
MPIRQHIPEHACFEPEAVAVMSKAFEEACIALQVFPCHERGREIVATRIVDLARNGVIDAKALRDRVLLESRSAAQVNQVVPLRV